MVNQENVSEYLDENLNEINDMAKCDIITLLEEEFLISKEDAEKYFECWEYNGKENWWQ